MSHKLVIGVDGTDASKRVLDFVRKQAKLISDCEIIVAFVIEWSPFTFQTPEENAERHKRREEELHVATTRVVDPVVKELTADGFTAKGVVRHGDVATTLDSLTREHGGEQIIVGRTSATDLSSRIFGSATQKLVMHASVPVTVVV